MGVLHLIRHGKASFGEPDYDVLSAVGHDQARLTGETLGRRFERVTTMITGPARRQRSTAEGLRAGLTATLPEGESVPEPVVDERWDEYDSMDILTHTRIEPPPEAGFQEVLDTALHLWIRDEPGEGAYREPFAAFIERIGSALADAAAAASGSGNNVVVTTSAGAIAATMLNVWGIPHERFPAIAGALLTASVTKFAVGTRGITAIGFNDHAHLDVAAPDGTRPLIHYR